MRNPIPKIFIGLGLALLAAGCGSHHAERRENASSSLVSYLYGKQAPAPAAKTGTYGYGLPATVGLAFVPAQNTHGGQPLSEALKNSLLEQVRASFRDKPFIGDIKIIPEAYLRGGDDGFQTIEQLSRLYGFDVVALVSYDQLALASQNKSSLLYWTLAGAYLVKGDRSDVSTFVDTAVFDVASRQLMLRAGGSHHAKQSATAIEQERVMLEAREDGFRAATGQMIRQLDEELARFHAARQAERRRS